MKISRLGNDLRFQSDSKVCFRSRCEKPGSSIHDSSA